MISLERACTMGVLILAGLVTAAVPVYANSPSLADRVIEHKLANGMTVLMVERHQAPIVSINMTFGVGGVNEQVGLTGLAHLYEHMAFKGTRTVGTRDYEREQAVLDDLTLVGNELDGRERAESTRAEMEGSPTFPSQEVQQLQRRFKGIAGQSRRVRGGQRDGAVVSTPRRVGLNASTGKATLPGT